jgi:hypothetical protein
MKNFYFFILFALISALSGCSSERVAVGPSPPREQEIVRFRSKDPTKEPIVFGQIKVVDETDVYVLSAAILSLDENITFADKSGNYRFILKPGIHHFMTGQIGIYQSRLTLNVEKGDSIRINFHLKPDPRPLE